MPIINRIAEFHPQMIEWRHDIHAHPELAFEEQRTADIVAQQLESYGIETHRGLAQTGVVGVLKNGDGPSIGLRADMDALPIQEQNDFSHRSRHAGKMHACGHDGHTSMLLGAAKYLAETRRFKGTVNFIFQPAEEGEGGARVMIEQGLFEKFPCQSVYGVHNMPGHETGTIHVRSGPMMAAYDTFQIKVHGRGGLGGEDFAFMLEQVPGCYLFIGNGAGEGTCMVHNSTYDFNDDILPVGATYFSRLVETVLAND